MPTDHSDDNAQQSTYPVLEKPEFRSQIPVHLMSKSSEAEQHMMSQLSIMTQYIDWSVHAHIATNQQVRKTNGRLLVAEEDIDELQDDKRSIVRGWRFMVGVGGAIAGIVSFLVLIYQALHGGE